MRVVVDTGVLVSGLIRKQNTPGALLSALRDHRFTAVYSTEMLIEVVDVLGRPRFRIKYHIQPSDVTALIHLIRLRGELVTPAGEVAICRDPKDNKFLAAALVGKVDCIVSGDSDLLVLSPFQGIPILRPTEFLALM